MNPKRFALTAGTIFVFAILWNGIVHLVLLKEANRALDPLARPLAERSLPLGLVLTAAIAVLFVYSYASCVRAPGVLHGLRHGAFFGVLAGLLVDLNQFLVYPLPGSLPAMWAAFGFVEFCLYGVLAAWLYPAPP